MPPLNEKYPDFNPLTISPRGDATRLQSPQPFDHPLLAAWCWLLRRDKSGLRTDPPLNSAGAQSVSCPTISAICSTMTWA